MRILDPQSKFSVGLKGFWPLDDPGLAFARDISAGRNHARYVTTMPTRVYNGIGPGVYWPSTGGQLQAADFKIPANTAVSFSFWIGPQLNNPSGAFSMGSGELCGCWAAYGQDFTWDYPRGASGRLVVDYTPFYGKLTHAVVVSNGLNFRAVYLNGRVIGSNTGTEAAATNLTTLNIGRYVAGSGSSLRTLNNFRVWNRVLTPQEISELYTNPWVGTGLPKRTYLQNTATPFTPIVMGLY